MTQPQKRKLSEHVRQRTREWFRKAEHELAFLDLAPFDADDPPTDTVGKMAHMAAEYSLKAYLMLNKREITKSHDLVELLDDRIVIHGGSDFEVLRPDCQSHTRYRMEFVYPGPTPEVISVADAQAAIAKAHRIMTFLKGRAPVLGYHEN